MQRFFMGCLMVFMLAACGETNQLSGENPNPEQPEQPPVSEYKEGWTEEKLGYHMDECKKVFSDAKCDCYIKEGAAKTFSLDTYENYSAGDDTNKKLLEIFTACPS